MSPIWPSTAVFATTVVFAAAIAHSTRAALPGVIGRVRRGMVALAEMPLVRMALVFAVTFFSFSLPMMLGAKFPPWAHDEFANLLAADTFLHGRVTNPTPLAWQQLETFHELMRPTYQSKYPPAEGLFLALGRWLGLPHAGTTAVMALVAVVLVETVRLWLPATIVLFAGLLAASMPVLHLWGENYWGVGPTTLGAALLLWAVCATLRRRVGHRTTGRLARGCACGLGLVILANGRPLEGLIFAVLCGAWCLCAAILRPAQWRELFRMGGWALPILVAGLGWMLFYNYRVTGDALMLPYSAHAQQYMTMPLLRWQSARAAPGPDVLPRVARFHRIHETSEWTEEDRVGFWTENSAKLAREAKLFFDVQVTALPLALIPFGLLLRGNRRRMMMGTVLPPLVVALAVAPVQILMTRWFRENYLGPVLPPLFLATVLGTWWLARTLPGMRRFRLAVPLLLGLTAASMFNAIRYPVVVGNDAAVRLGAFREKLIGALRARPLPALVLVKESDDLSPVWEVVFNDAEPGASPVVFAHSTDAASDAAVVRAYPGRTLWRLDCRPESVQLQPVDASGVGGNMP